jgi:hypothetical protein
MRHATGKGMSARPGIAPPGNIALVLSVGAAEADMAAVAGGTRANFLLRWSGKLCGVPFSLRENGHECEATTVHPQEILH